MSGNLQDPSLIDHSRPSPAMATNNVSSDVKVICQASLVRSISWTDLRDAVVENDPRENEPGELDQEKSPLLSRHRRSSSSSPSSLSIPSPRYNDGGYEDEVGCVAVLKKKLTNLRRIVTDGGETSIDDGNSTNLYSSAATSTFAPSRPSIRKLACVALLVFINLINYMDRYTISAVLPEIQRFYGIDDTKSGMLSTSFILSFMVLAPIFGYLGDRYNRIVIMSGGILFWAATTLAGSFVPAAYFDVFITLRALVGIGEASYSTIAPTIIADMFTNEWRTGMLTIFYFAIPAGAGLGFIVAGYVEQATGNWQDVLRITPALGLLSVILLWVILRKDPPRGEAEGATSLKNTGWLSDLYHIVRNKSFVFSCLGYTAQCFIVGAVSFWVPTVMSRAYVLRGETPPQTGIAKIFGLITAISGIIGVVAGTVISSKWKTKCNSSKPDCWVSAIGLICCSPLLFLALIRVQYDASSTWVMVFFVEVLLCLDWAIVTDILLYVTVPTRRSTAEAFQILCSHALGDAGSSYLVGQMSDAINKSLPDDVDSSFLSLQRSLFINPFVGIVGGLFFLVCAWYIDRDKAIVDAVIAGALEDTPAILTVTPDDGQDELLIDASRIGDPTPQVTPRVARTRTSTKKDAVVTS